MTTSTPTYTERLLPGPGGWFASLGGSALLGVVALAVGPTTALVVTVAAVVVAAVVVWMLAPLVRVVDGELIAGAAHIPVDLLGPVEILDAAGVTRALGPGSDARTFVCLRASTGHAVYTAVLDERDPTPAWLISTRRPEQFAAAIDNARTSATSTVTE